MKSMQKFISLWLTLCLVLSMVPVQVFAEDIGEKTEFQKISLTISGEQEYGSDELYAAYAESLFYGGISLFGNAAGNRLTGDERVIYDALVPMIRQIANGERASATITIGQDVTYEGVFYPVDQEAQFIGSNLTDEMLNRVVDALLADLPFECYWYEKTTGCTCGAIMGETIQQVMLQFSVADNYQDGDLYTVDTAKTGLAKAAADKAMSIVSANSHLSDYDKLIAYRNAICDLVSYDDAAADGNYFDTDIDPWQLISVFDGDPSTNVVCEGYSKAFMYLCDQSTFSGEIAVYTVMGTMDGGPHMWNVVSIDGKNYLADVTNSDTGTTGANGGLFLAGAAGTAASSYSVAGVSYVYDSDTISLWGTGADSILTLGATGYTPDAEGESVIASGTCGENLTWVLTSDGILTISGEGEMESSPWNVYYSDLITSAIIGDHVTSIGVLAFAGCTNLTSVVIPNSVKTLGYGAFIDCSVLREIILPSSITYIPESAFLRCTSIIDIILPESVTEIGASAFAQCEKLEEVNLPSGLSILGNGVFAECSSLVSISIPEGITAIPANAFSGCSNLAQIDLPNSIIDIGASAFEHCENIETITIPTRVTRIEARVFAFCRKLTSVVIPVGVTYIGQEAFFNTSLYDVNIPEGVTTIADSAFNGIWELTHITLPDTVTYIGRSAFGSCLNLESIHIPDGVEYLGPYALWGTDLTEIIIPESLTSFENGLFYECYSLSKITIPNSVTTIGDLVFANCYQLDNITIPASVTSLGATIFEGSGVKTIVFLGDVPQISENSFSAKTMSVFYPADNETWTKDVMQDYGGTITWAVIGSDVDPGDGENSDGETGEGTGDGSGSGEGSGEGSGSDSGSGEGSGEGTGSGSGSGEGSGEGSGSDSGSGEGSGEGTGSGSGSGEGSGEGTGDSSGSGEGAGNSGTTDVGDILGAPDVLDDSLSWIYEEGVLTISGEGPMKDYTGFDTPWNEYRDQIKSVVIEAGVTSVGKYALYCCSNLETVILPDTITAIKENACSHCTNLVSINLPEGLKSIGLFAFMNCTSLGEISFPSTLVVIEGRAFTYTQIAQIEIPVSLAYLGNGPFGENTVEINVDSENPFFESVDGVLFNEDKTVLIQYPAAKGDIEYVIPESVKSLSAGAFIDAVNLVCVDVPNSATDWAHAIFAGCVNLQKVTIPVGVTTLGSYVFEDCFALETVIIPNTVTSIQTGAFYMAQNLKEIVIPNSVTTIGNQAFQQCISLTEISIPDSVRSIGQHAFAWCDGVDTVIIGAGLFSLGECAFEGCINMKSIVVSANNEWFVAVDGVLFDKDMTTIIKYPQNRDENVYTIPETIKQLGAYSFSQSSNLEWVSFPSGLEEIGPSAFLNCESLELIEIPGSATTIGDSAFSCCYSLTSVTIPDGISIIGNWVFCSCPSLTSIIIPDSVTTIGNYAFDDCSSLTSVTIGNSVNTIGDYAFDDCTSLTGITFAGDAPSFGWDPFYNVSATACYPAGNTTWTSDVMQDYGGTITWKPCCTESHTEETIPGKAATCTETGLTEGKKCTICGVITVEQEVIPATGIHVYENGVCKYCGMEEPPVEDQLENLVDNNASAEKIRDAVQNMDTEELKTSMEQDSAAVENIAALEQTVGGAAEIAVEDASVGIAENEVSIIGANLNPVDEGKAAILVIGAAAKKNEVPAEFEATSAVHFSMTLENVENTKQLEVPVKISLPVPENLDPNNVIVLHYHDGKTEVLTPAIHQEGGKHFASIVLTGFSDFAIAQKTHEHSWVDATCTTPKICSVCKVTEGKPAGHTYDDNVDGTCNVCDVHREEVENRIVVHMFRMYNPNTGEHFYTGSEEERDNLIGHGWQYEGVGFTFPANTGAPVHRLFQESTGEHLYTMDEAEKAKLEAEGWNYEGIAFNSAYDTEAVQHRLHNPNATVGAFHFTFSLEEKQNLIDAGWEYQGIGWYSCWK